MKKVLIIKLNDRFGCDDVSTFLNETVKKAPIKCLFFIGNKSNWISGSWENQCRSSETNNRSKYNLCHFRSISSWFHWKIESEKSIWPVVRSGVKFYCFRINSCRLSVGTINTEYCSLNLVLMLANSFSIGRLRANERSKGRHIHKVVFMILHTRLCCAAHEQQLKIKQFSELSIITTLCAHIKSIHETTRRKKNTKWMWIWFVFFTRTTEFTVKY